MHVFNFAWFTFAIDIIRVAGAGGGGWNFSCPRKKFRVGMGDISIYFKKEILI